MLNYPTPHATFASDITVHLTEEFQHYADKVENQIASDQYTYEISFAIQHSTKARHGEHWHSQLQEKFGKIKGHADGLNRVMENLIVNVKAHHDDGDDDCDDHNVNNDTNDKYNDNDNDNCDNSVDHDDRDLAVIVNPLGPWSLWLAYNRNLGEILLSSTSK